MFSHQRPLTQVFTSASDATPNDLFDAIEKNDLPRVERLLLNNVSANSVVEKQTALMHAVSHNNFAIAKLLIEHKADVNATNPYGVTPLMMAVANKPEIVKLLVDSGAKRELKNAAGKTALMLCHEKCSRQFFAEIINELTRPLPTIAANGDTTATIEPERLQARL